MLRVAARGLLIALSFESAANASEPSSLVGTLTTDGLSFISFGDREIVAIPPGSTLRFRFGPPQADGSVPCSIGPDDVSIAPIALASGQGVLHYGLAGVASGTLRFRPGGADLELSARVKVAIERPEGGGSTEYSMAFTTKEARASSLDRSDTVAVEGAPVPLNARYVQLVAATTNKEAAFPEPGAAVYTVISGTFDRLPSP